MINLDPYKSQLESNGFTTIPDVFSNEETEQMLKMISKADTSKGTFRKSADLFAIRQFLKEVPEINQLILNDKFKLLVHDLFGLGYFIVKSIYFDKPEQSNWFVSYHQDLTISVNKRTELDGYSKWTVKQDQFSVQPPLDILRQVYTVRIHLDDTDENNGALKVIPGSHLKGVYRAEDIDWSNEIERICDVTKGV
ncbi:phytanoyl-CoA dioxygenase family protein [Pedobacter steynii]